MTIKEWALGLAYSVQAARYVLKAGKVKTARKVKSPSGGLDRWDIPDGIPWPEREKPGRRAKRISI